VQGAVGLPAFFDFLEVVRWQRVEGDSTLADVSKPIGAWWGCDGVQAQAPLWDALLPLLRIWRRRDLLLFALDVLVVISAFMLSYYLRFYVQFLAIKTVPIVEFEIYLKGAFLLAALWSFFNWRGRAYERGLQGVSSPMLRLQSLLRAGAYAVGLLMVISFMYRGLLLSRQVYLMTSVIALSSMALIRLLFRAIDQDLALQGVVLQRLALVGAGEQSRRFVEHLQRDAGTIGVVGCLTWNKADGEVAQDTDGLPLLGSFHDVAEIHERTPFDMLVLSLDDLPAAEQHSDDTFFKMVNFCEKRGVSLYSLPPSFHVTVTQDEVGSLAGVPIVRLRDAHLHPFYAVVKRVMDICIAASVLLVGLPLWLAIAALIKLTSKGPVFFVQTRAGLHGRPFRIYKFRTMVQDAESRLSEVVDIDKLEVPGFKIKNDPRVTRLGRLLRRLSLDEIPQLINVLKGDMSLVGPRPEMPALVGRYTPEQRRRLKGRPGITGLQQVMARGVPLAAATKYDLTYLKNQSLLVDLYILFKTVVVVARGSGVTH